MANLIIKSKLKDFCNEKNFRCSKDVVDNLDILLKGWLVRAMNRAVANGRRTVQSKDI